MVPQDKKRSTRLILRSLFIVFKIEKFPKCIISSQSPGLAHQLAEVSVVVDPSGNAFIECVPVLTMDAPIVVPILEISQQLEQRLIFADFTSDNTWVETRCIDAPD